MSTVQLGQSFRRCKAAHPCGSGVPSQPARGPSEWSPRRLTHQPLPQTPGRPAKDRLCGVAAGDVTPS